MLHRDKAKWASVTLLFHDADDVRPTFDAIPDYRHSIPGGSIWPLFLALCMGVVFIGSIFSPYFVLVGVAISLIGLAAWGWVSTSERSEERVALPGGAVRSR